MGRRGAKRRAALVAATLAWSLAPFAQAGLPAPPVEQWRFHPASVDWLLRVTDTIPIVVQLTDDDGDGDIDTNDSPDVVFVTRRNGGGDGGALWALDGATGELHWWVDGTFGRAIGGTFGGAALAAGDLDGDGYVEIVVQNAGGYLIFEHDGSAGPVLLVAVDPGENHAISLADLDQDGVPEIIDQALVISADGSWQWRGTAGGFGGQHTSWSLAVDFRPDLPGLELFAGNTLYGSTGNVIWQSAVGEGAAVIGDLNGDGRLEIPLAVRRSLHLLDDEGNELVTPLELAGDWTETTGLPLLAELDGDTNPEVVLPANSELIALEWNGGSEWSELWRIPLDDPFGIANATAYDIDGDGIDEILHRDWTQFLIRDGRCGSLLHAIDFPSNTGIEIPVIANIDDDPAPEVLVTSLALTQPDWLLMIAYELPGGCTPRPIWNQPSFHGTNVNDDGSIPRVEPAPWSSGARYFSQSPAAATEPATGLAPFTASPGGDCANSVTLTWQPALLPGGAMAAYDLWRLYDAGSTSCCNEANGVLLASGWAGTSFVDDGASLGATLRYLVRARSTDGSTCAGLSLCSDAVALDDPTLLPAPTGPTLRVTHGLGSVVIDWTGARALEDGEHFHLLRAGDAATATFTRINPEQDTARSHSDADLAAELLFYDLRIADVCENQSPH